MLLGCLLTARPTRLHPRSFCLVHRRVNLLADLLPKRPASAQGAFFTTLPQILNSPTLLYPFQLFLKKANAINCLSFVFDVDVGLGLLCCSPPPPQKKITTASFSSLQAFMLEFGHKGEAAAESARKQVRASAAHPHHPTRNPFPSSPFPQANELLERYLSQEDGLIKFQPKVLDDIHAQLADSSAAGVALAFKVPYDMIYRQLEEDVC